jgi:hypothetical protein
MKITKASLEALAKDPTVSVQQSAFDAAPCPYVGDVVDGWWLPEDIENPEAGQEFVAVKSFSLGQKTLVFARRFRIEEIKEQPVISVRGPEDMSILNPPNKMRIALRLLEVVLP